VARQAGSADLKLVLLATRRGSRRLDDCRHDSSGSLAQFPEALVLLRKSRQIELLFKFGKEYGFLGEWRTNTKMHSNVIYLGFARGKRYCTLQTQVSMIISCWRKPHRSLVKAVKVTHRHITLLSAAFDGNLDLSIAVQRIQKAAQAGAHLKSCCDAPNTSQMLFT
jgi:hypothetical protein